jgi:transcriptional regulator with XRE-family HTH domain
MMPGTVLTGSRIRERRMALGVRQAELAQRAGLSASYLNLIEHNRRKVGGDVLARIALALGLEVQVLAGSADDGLMQDLRSAVADGRPFSGMGGPACSTAPQGGTVGTQRRGAERPDDA